MSAHRIDDTQVLIVRTGSVRVTLNLDAPVSTVLGPYDTLSVPVGAWRTIESIGAEVPDIIVVTGNEARTDPNGYLAPASLLND